MRRISLCIFVSLLFTTVQVVNAQKTKTKTKTTKKTTEAASTPKATEKKGAATTNQDVTSPSGDKDNEKIKDIVSFLQFVLNTLGNPATSSRDKDVLITQSYSKIFRDDKVQVEDDLDENREVITNKDIVAYLKDVDFFFDQVKFEFAVEDIKSNTLPNGDLFYKVTTRRTLEGITTDGGQVKNVQPRFIEINFNPDEQDLKIVSIYTKEFDEKAALTNWWNDLSYEWRSIFKQKFNLQADSLSVPEIKRITLTDTLDLTANKYIQNIEPLAQLAELKTLKLAETKIADLTPIRNLTALIELDLARTGIVDLTPLRYSTNLKKLNLSSTSVSEISVLEKMLALEDLNLQQTKVTDFAALAFAQQLSTLNISSTSINSLAPIEKLTLLKDIDLSKTLVQDLAPVRNLSELETIRFDSTKVSNLSPLAGNAKLKVIRADFTSISSLDPLKSLSNLERIYCDQTQITRTQADEFLKTNPKTLVIYDSKDLQSWWNSLSDGWRSALEGAASIGNNPTKEELASVTNLDSVNLTRNPAITDLEPLRKLLKLRIVLIGGTAAKDLSPLEDHREITRLDISDTPHSDIFLVRQFSKLKEFRADNTKVEKLDALFGLKELAKVYVDHTSIHDLTAAEFLEKNPKCLLVYKTHHLRRWWSETSSDWKFALRSQMGSDTVATRENLHALVESQKLEITDANINDLRPLNEFVILKRLSVTGTGVAVFPGLDNLKTLTSLKISNSPLQGIAYIGQLRELMDLDISNTPVDELKPLGALENLKSLNCSGTQIKKLDPLERLGALESLDCSNTKVGSIDALERLPLKTLKVYNTKVSSRAIDKFKERKPACNVIFYR